MIASRLGALKFATRTVVARVLHGFALRTCVAVLAAAFTFPLRGETELPLTEYQVEAAFLYQFTKYVTWPPQAFATPHEPLMIGVLGDDPFGDDLARAVAREKPVQGHPLRIMRGHNAADLARCQILFISGSEEPRVAQHLTTLERLKSPALTVGESQNFLAEGGAIRFVVENKKIRFEINARNAERAGVSISSKLLSLARNTRDRT